MWGYYWGEKHASRVSIRGPPPLPCLHPAIAANSLAQSGTVVRVVFRALRTIRSGAGVPEPPTVTDSTWVYWNHWNHWNHWILGPVQNWVQSNTNGYTVSGETGGCRHTSTTQPGRLAFRKPSYLFYHVTNGAQSGIGHPRPLFLRRGGAPRAPPGPTHGR
jgi:hypothetical protein